MNRIVEGDPVFLRSPQVGLPIESRPVRRFYNPDREPSRDYAYLLGPWDTPPHLHSIFVNYSFRRAGRKEVISPEFKALTQKGWPNLDGTNDHDMIRDFTNNEPTAIVIDRQNGHMVGYTRLEAGWTNDGKPNLHSDMTTVSPDVRDGGVGEALKWEARKIALEFPEQPTTLMSVHFDPIQGRLPRVNLNKLGMVVGAAGGLFEPDCYPGFGGAQNVGYPSDRFRGRWYLNAEWTMAHLEDRVKLPTEDEVKDFPSALRVGNAVFFQPGQQERHPVVPVPGDVDTDLLRTQPPYVVVPSPFDWNGLLKLDEGNNFATVMKWRMAQRAVFRPYFDNGYTAIAQATDKPAGLNRLVLARNFDPINPPAELLKPAGMVPQI